MWYSNDVDKFKPVNVTKVSQQFIDIIKKYNLFEKGPVVLTTMSNVEIKDCYWVADEAAFKVAIILLNDLDYADYKDLPLDWVVGMIS